VFWQFSIIKIICKTAFADQLRGLLVRAFACEAW